MKTIIVTVLILLVAGLSFAGGEREAKTIEILVTNLEAPVGDMDAYDYAEAKVLEKYPDVEFVYKVVDLTTGSAITMDTLIASGQAPDVYADSMVRASRYMTPDFALDMSEYLDLSMYTDLGPFTRDGKVVGLPGQGGAQGMAINLDLLEKVGYTIPDDWTLSDFFDMCEAVKQYSEETGEEVYGTGLFAGNQSGDYLWTQWFSVFGVDLYSDDYTKSTQINGGAEVWNFYRTLIDKGYIPPNTPQLVDDDYVIQWARGMFAATAFYPSWTEPYFDSVMKQGLIDKPFNYKFIEFPNDAPACSNFNGTVVNKDTEYPEIAMEYVKALGSVEVREAYVIHKGSLAFREDVTAEPRDEKVKQVNKIVEENGMYDLGVTNPWFAEVRAQGFPILQEVLMGKMTGEEAAKEYTERVNEIIAP